MKQYLECGFAIKKFTLSLLLILLSLSGPLYAQAKVEVQYAQVGEVKLAYYTRGQGEPIILIAGYSQTIGMWDPGLLDELSKNNKLIIFDNRGISLSTDSMENKTTIAQMADDAAGLVRALGYKKVNILGWSMGARIAQQFLIRHHDLVIKGILCSPNPGGKFQIKASKKVTDELNNPNLSLMENVALLFPQNEAGKQAAKDALARLNAAKLAGTIPLDFNISKETKMRQDRARTVLWDSDNQNYVDLRNIKVPVLVADWYQSDYFASQAKQYGKNAINNPKGPTQSYDPDDYGVPANAPKRVIRGGSFLCNEDYCQSYRPSARRGSDPYSPMSHLGFRLVKDPD